MTVAQMATPSTVRAELADADEEVKQLEKQLAQARQEAAAASRAGNAVLGALEAGMAPLMAELAATWRQCSQDADGAHPEPLGASTQAELESELQHLQLDIAHYKERAEKMQVEGRQRDKELKRLRAEISEAAENLSYEQQRVKHHEVGEQVGFGVQDHVWGGLGPSGIGRRTIEVRAEKKLRESAEQRGGRLSRDISKLASQSSQQQATVAQLSRKLGKVRRAVEEREMQLSLAGSTSQQLQTKLNTAVEKLEKRMPVVEYDDAEMDEVPSVDGDMTRAALRPPASLGGGAGQSMPRKKNMMGSSTGKLPHLSF